MYSGAYIRLLYNFYFSIQIVLPLFLLIFLGYILRKKHITTDSFIQTGNNIVFKIALPASMFYNVYSQPDIRGLFDIGFVLFIIIGAVLSFLAAWLIAWVFIKDRTIMAAFIHGAFRGNFVILGLPLLHSFIGIENSGMAAIVILFTIPMYNIFAIIVLSIYSDSEKKVNFLYILKQIITNPLTIGIAAGFVLALFQINMPMMFESTIRHISRMTTPLALICMGGGLEVGFFNKKMKYSVWAAIYKTAILPIIAVLAAYALGFRSYELVVILVTFAVPAAVASFTMTVLMGGDSYVGATSVIFSTVFSLFTLTGFIYVFVTLGLV